MKSSEKPYIKHLQKIEINIYCKSYFCRLIVQSKLQGSMDIVCFHLIKNKVEDELPEKELTTEDLNALFKLNPLFLNNYLGEQINFAISLSNKMNEELNGTLDVQLITPNKFIHLVNQQKVILNNVSTKYEVFTHEIKELGKYEIICTFNANFKTKKTFSFIAKNPLSVKTKISQLETKLFLEVQLQNLCSESIFMRTIKFEGNDKVIEQLDSENVPFNVNDVRQYMFTLESFMQNMEIGKIDINWKNSTGQLGRLQTSSLKKKITHLRDFMLTADFPKIVVEVPFKVKFNLINELDQTVRCNFMLKIPVDANINVNGFLRENVLEFAPKEQKEFEIEFLAIECGLQNLKSFILNDAETGFVYNIVESFKVLVHRE